MKRIILATASILFAVSAAFGWSRPSTTPSCENCTGTKAIIKINNAQYFNCWGSHIDGDDGILQDCSNSQGYSGYYLC